ncbi:MAG: TolC family protein [Thermoanaerobaculia bacterium]|nr:TolC family protein [Thermoanaerobaculia bacterium]
MKRQCTALALAVLMASAAHAADVVELDLATVVAMALERNAALKAEEERRHEVAGGVEEAGADAWPQVDVITHWNRSRSPSLLNSPDFEEFVEQFPGFTPGEQELYTVGVEVSQPIYSGGKVRAALDLAELVVDITDSQIDAVRLDTALSATEAWYRLQAARASLRTVTSQQEARRESLQVVQDRFDLGEATRLELLRAEAALAEVGPTAAEAEGRVVVEAARLRALLGLESEVEIRGQSTTDTDVPQVPTRDELIHRAFETRPELRDLLLQEDALHRQRTVAAAESKPQVELNGEYGRQVRLLENLDDDLFQNWSVSVSLSWNVFDGGRVAGQVAQIDSQKAQLQWRREELRRQIVADVEQSLAALRTAVESERASVVSAAAATEAARVAAETYRQGVALQADLLDAQDRAISAELEATQARLERQIQWARLKRAIGRLPTDSLEAATHDPETARGSAAPDEFPSESTMSISIPPSPGR